jgi:hypothetical protein
MCRASENRPAWLLLLRPSGENPSSILPEKLLESAEIWIRGPIGVPKCSPQSGTPYNFNGRITRKPDRWNRDAIYMDGASIPNLFRMKSTRAVCDTKALDKVNSRGIVMNLREICKRNLFDSMGSDSPFVPNETDQRMCNLNSVPNQGFERDKESKY